MLINFTHRKTFFLVSVLVLSTLVLAILFFFVRSKQGLTFSNDKFSFKTPPGWHYEDLKATGLENLIVVKVYQNNPDITFHVSTKLAANQIELSELPKELRASFQKGVKNFEELGMSFPEVGGQNALRYEYRYQATAPGGRTFLTHQELFITEVGETVFYLVGQAREEDYETARPKLAQILNSLKFK